MLKFLENPWKSTMRWSAVPLFRVVCSCFRIPIDPLFIHSLSIIYPLFIHDLSPMCPLLYHYIHSLSIIYPLFIHYLSMIYPWFKSI
jgi:hypothetical protein